MTLNNYTEADIELVGNWAAECTRIVVSKEVGSEGTPHLQGVMSWRSAKRLAALKKLCSRAHWEVAIAAKDFTYPMKDDSEIVVNVDNRENGKRNDLDSFKEAIKGGASNQVLWEEHFGCMIRYGKMVPEYRSVLRGSVRSGFTLADYAWEPIDYNKPTILWGAPGIGKTQFALAHFEKPLLVRTVDDLKRLDDHDGIVFDDMSFLHWPRETQIHLLDELDSSIHCRFHDAVIPGNMPRIFTTNVSDGMIFMLEDGAIRRRVVDRELTSSTTDTRYGG